MSLEDQFRYKYRKLIILGVVIPCLLIYCYLMYLWTITPGNLQHDKIFETYGMGIILFDMFVMMPLLISVGLTDSSAVYDVYGDGYDWVPVFIIGFIIFAVGSAVVSMGGH